MPREPKPSSFPAIRGALTFYQVASIITGVMLLLLLAEMILKYSPLHVELFAGGSGGFLWSKKILFGPKFVFDIFWSGMTRNPVPAAPNDTKNTWEHY